VIVGEDDLLVGCLPAILLDDPSFGEWSGAAWALHKYI